MQRTRSSCPSCRTALTAIISAPKQAHHHDVVKPREQCSETYGGTSSARALCSRAAAENSTGSCCCSCTLSDWKCFSVETRRRWASVSPPAPPFATDPSNRPLRLTRPLEYLDGKGTSPPSPLGALGLLAPPLDGGASLNKLPNRRDSKLNSWLRLGACACGPRPGVAPTNMPTPRDRLGKQ